MMRPFSTISPSPPKNVGSTQYLTAIIKSAMWVIYQFTSKLNHCALVCQYQSAVIYVLKYAFKAWSNQSYILLEFEVVYLVFLQKKMGRVKIKKKKKI